MEINILKDYNQINVSSKRHVDFLIEEIETRNIRNDKHVILDLSDCITDYPQTPRLIDHILYHLAKLEGQKEFKIIYNNLGTEEVFILYDIILEGKYFGISQKINSKEEITGWLKIISDKLKKDNIIMEIYYSYANITYKYGE